jgi:pimeloyl-ACP methyl ester carboxylesterase
MYFEEKRYEAPDGISLFFRDSGPHDGKPALLMLHSLSDNGRVFDAVIAAGLDRHFRLILPDGRGRGRSQRPESGYSLHTHAADLIALLNHLGLDQVAIAGHSFGGLLGLYFAAKHPRRTASLTVIDAAVEMNSLTPLFLVALSDRLGRWYPSEEAYISSLRAAPFMTLWDEAMRATFLEDTQAMPDGSVYVMTQKRHIAQAAGDIMLQTKRDWRRRALAYKGPALVINAAEPFMLAQRISEPQKALETAVLLAGADGLTVPGNHMTMLYGAGAKAIADSITARFAPALMRA